jgi:hypothetical protein
VRPEGLRSGVHGGQEWEAMQREIKKKNMYQAASFTGDFGEATFASCYCHYPIKQQ